MIKEDKHKMFGHPNCIPLEIYSDITGDDYSWPDDDERPYSFDDGRIPPQLLAVSKIVQAINESGCVVRCVSDSTRKFLLSRTHDSDEFVGLFAMKNGSICVRTYHSDRSDSYIDDLEELVRVLSFLFIGKETSFDHKLSFHIPHVAFIDGRFIDVPYDEFEDAFGMKLVEAGIDAWHITASVGIYKGRKYEQDILSVFCEADDKANVINAFIATIKAHHIMMRQEAYAYEHNGRLQLIEP